MKHDGGLTIAEGQQLAQQLNQPVEGGLHKGVADVEV
ncbi:hypothetical protein N7470_000697 [Penicillium chermesinum]|nr:hypothetical protein N7470_000697 [Penicillium chermesinum]